MPTLCRPTFSGSPAAGIVGGLPSPGREASLKLAGSQGPADFPDLVDLMDEREIEAARQKARREYGTERAPAARRALQETVAAQMERNLPRASP